MGQRGLGRGVIENMVQLTVVNVFTIGNGDAGNTKAKGIMGLVNQTKAHGIAKGIPAFGKRG